IGLTSGFGDDWLRIGSLKLFADGALGPRTASMIAPYEGEPNNYGIVVTDKEEMFALVSMALQNGISTAVHAIGDKANHDVLDVFEEAAKLDASSSSVWNAVPTKMRHRIEHAQVLHPSDLSRFQELNVIASMQPIHAVVDKEMADRHWGPRCENAYAWRSLIESGAVVAFGSDAPVESIRPLDGIYAAVTRKRAGRGADEESWVPRQRITVPMAVAGYTLGAAIASGREHYMGRIKRGYLADVTILDRDIYTMDPEEIPSTGIGGVVVNGDLVYRNW
ncbi:MAG: amidohydrolase, partial [Candidatus Promineifilaceae bacterium]